MPKYGWGWIGATALYCAAIFYLSSQPDLGKDPPAWLDWPQSDKAVHVIMYGGLSGLVGVGLLRSNSPRLGRRALFWGPALFATLFGVSDEIHQYFVPSRTCDVLDLCADAAGATIIAGVIAVWAARPARSAAGGE
jgi:hypothetical protein